VHINKIPEEIIKKYDPELLSFFNINNEKELDTAKQILINKSNM
jgi:hypothetical protein